MKKQRKPRKQAKRFRLLPLTIACAFLGLSVKMMVLIQEGPAVARALFISDSIARSSEAEAENKDKKEAKPDEKAADKKADAKEGEKAAEKSDEIELPESKEKSVCDFSQTEIDLLQSLTKRREELEKRAQQIGLREDLLKATELKIDQKIADIKSLKGEVETLLAQYNVKEEAKIRSLVKIYESMKPSDAARVFNELEMNVLLQVVDKMQELKAAPILAKMSPTRAKELTFQLARQKRLPERIEEATEGATDAEPLPAPAATPEAVKPATP